MRACLWQLTLKYLQIAFGHHMNIEFTKSNPPHSIRPTHNNGFVCTIRLTSFAFRQCVMRVRVRVRAWLLFGFMDFHRFVHAMPFVQFGVSLLLFARAGCADGDSFGGGGIRASNWRFCIVNRSESEPAGNLHTQTFGPLDR